MRIRISLRIDFVTSAIEQTKLIDSDQVTFARERLGEALSDREPVAIIRGGSHEA